MTNQRIRILGTVLVIFALTLSFVPVVSVSADAIVPPDVEDGTTVWDFENMPADLDGWYSDLYSECGWNAVGTIGMGAGGWTLSVEEGKGVGGSKALSCFLPQHIWGNTTYVEMVRDSTAVTDWGAAENLMFYVDASGIEDEHGVRLDIILKDYESYLEGYPHPVGAGYSVWKDGAWAEMSVNEWGHIIIPAGYTGWLKVSIANVLGVTDVSEVTRIGFYTEHNTPNGTVYLDHFTIDAKVDVPGEYADPSEISEGTVVWDMENLAGDLTAWTTDKFFELWGDETVGVMGGNWKPVSIATKGFNGSNALGWRMLTTEWGSTTYVNLDHDNTAITDWSGATELYFYIDTTQVGKEMPIDILLPLEDPDVTMISGATYYIWKNNQWAERNVNEWNHLVIPANFAGWIRVPLAGVYGDTLDLSNVYRIGFYTEHTMINGTVYFDHFVINTKAEEKNGDAVTPTDPTQASAEPSQNPADPTEDTPEQEPSVDWVWIAAAAVCCCGVIAAALVIRKKRG